MFSIALERISFTLCVAVKSRLKPLSVEPYTGRNFNVQCSIREVKGHVLCSCIG
jgi:hypothetical protein